MRRGARPGGHRNMRVPRLRLAADRTLLQAEHMGDTPLSTALISCPVADGFGVAVAVWDRLDRQTQNRLWRDVFGDTHDGVDWPTPAPGQTGFVLVPDRKGQVTPIAFAADGKMEAWLRLCGLAPAGAVRAALAYVPGRSPDFPAVVASAYSLGPSEQATLAQLLASRDLAVLADKLGLSGGGTRKRVAALYRATGSTGLAALIARTTSWLGDEFSAGHAVEPALRQVLGLTAAEARTGMLIAEGRELPAIAETLRLSVHTVRDHARTAMLKAGVTRLKEFARISHEAGGLYVLATRTQSLPEDRGALRRVTRLIRRDQRQIALADYGPGDGVPVLHCHGGMGTRRVGADLEAALRSRGIRSIGIDRPGFGLTDMGDPTRPFEVAAHDMRAALDALGVERIVLVARDGGAPAAITFAALFPERVRAGVLLSPRWPRLQRTGHALADRFVRAAATRPEFINAWWRILRAQASQKLVLRLSQRLFAGHPADRACLEDDAFVRGLLGELLTCGARSSEGIATEQAAYQHWSPTDAAARTPWTIITGELDPLWRDPADGSDPWSALKPHSRIQLGGAGRFAITTHAPQIAELVQAACLGVGAAIE